MAAAKVECVFYGALFLEKVTHARRLFFSKIGVILTFPLHWQDEFCSLEFTPILAIYVRTENGKRLTSNRRLMFEVNVDLKVSNLLYTGHVRIIQNEIDSKK